MTGWTASGSPAPTSRPRSGRRPAEFGLPRLGARLIQIDLIKGLAMLGVLLLHSIPGSWLASTVTLFTIGQSVPVFVVLTGLNGVASLRRQGDAGLAALYSRRYLLSRVDRLYVPFLIVLAMSIAIALAKGTLTAGVVAAPVSALLPFSGPGNYYIAFVFQVAVLLPLLFFLYRRSPWAATIGAFVIAAAFEALAPHVGAFANSPFDYVYAAGILRFLPFLTVGGLMADQMLRGWGVPAWWWAGGIIGVTYLAILHGNVNVLALDDSDWRRWGETVLSVFYPALLVAIGLRVLPGRLHGALAHSVVVVGESSYEIFLVQILYFGLLAPVSEAMIVPSIIACCALGYGLHRALTWVPKLSLRVAV